MNLRKNLFSTIVTCTTMLTYPTHSKIVLSGKENSLKQLVDSKIWKENTPLKLHLGCGEQYFKGYLNIDFPSTEHTVQTNQVADVFADLTQLQFPDLSVDEIRSHHVFEHFNRSTALALVCKWNQWLKVGGTLVIETPDFETSIKMLQNPSYSYRQKQVILRHIFGSHEAGWAIHCDGWYKEKYEHILLALGFKNIRFEFTNWKLTHNIIVKATKENHIDSNQIKFVAKNLLRDHMVDNNEEKLWQIWVDQFGSVFQSQSN